MRICQCVAAACAVTLMTGGSAAIAQGDSGDAATDRQGLVKVKSKRFDALYVLPGADFRGYGKVMLDPTQVAFAKSWMRDMNRPGGDLSRRTRVEDAERIAEQARTGFGDIFAIGFKNAGYEVVTAPGADVVRLSPRVVDMYINAPDSVTTAPRTRVYTVDAGAATLLLQFRDSTTGALLGRAVDHRTANSRGTFRLSITSPVSNRGDFEALFDNWARISVKCLEELKAQSPVAQSAQPPKP